MQSSRRDETMHSMFARRSAFVGAIVWLLLLVATTSASQETELIHKVVFFAVLVVVPLCLSLIPGTELPYRIAVLAQPIAALVTIVSFFLEVGPLSAALSSAWLIITGLIASYGIARFRSRGFYPWHESGIDAGFLYLPVAGVWLVIYRLGIQPFDYGETIILLTVVHFHFAGFAAPIIAGMSARFLADRNYPRRLLVTAILAIIVAMPLVAAGITFSPWLGFIGTLLISTGLVLLAILTLGWVVPVIPGTGRRVLLSLGSLSICIAMVLACLYAYSLATKTLIITIPTMAMTHGLLNAFGFVTCSLLAWTRMTLK